MTASHRMDELATRAALFEAQCGAAVPVQPKTTVFVHNDVPYTHEFLSRAMERHAQRVIVAPDRTSAPLDLQIDEYEEILWDEVLKGRLVANAYCVRKGLIRKANFATAMSRSMGKRPNAVLSKGIPRTLVLNTWEAFAPSNTPGFGYIDL